MSGMAPWVQATAAIGTPLMVAVLGLAGAVWAKRLSKHTEDATARKLNAETISIEVETARGLIDEVRETMAHQRTDYEERLNQTRNEVHDLSQRLRVTEALQQRFSSCVAAHLPWDEAALTALRAVHPEYPSPPPLEVDTL